MNVHRSRYRESPSLAPSPDGGRRIRMMFHPVMSDVDAATRPHPVVALHVVEKPHQCRRTPGVPDEAAEGDRHHFGGALPLGVEGVEGIFEVGEEPIAGPLPKKEGGFEVNPGKICGVFESPVGLPSPPSGRCGIRARAPVCATRRRDTTCCRGSSCELPFDIRNWGHHA
jgi:hypothetical protein